MLNKIVSWSIELEDELNYLPVERLPANEEDPKQHSLGDRQYPQISANSRDDR